MLITGMHTVCDIQCSMCGNVLGWKYETAYEESQKYKEGKYILEKAKVVLQKDDGDTTDFTRLNGVGGRDDVSDDDVSEEENDDT